jgi:hypothetical protein
LSLLLLLLGAPGHLAGQDPCNPRFPPATDGNPPYERRGDRCEGFYRAPTGSSLELVSLTRGPITYNLTPGNHIVVTTPADVPPISPTARIAASALPLRTYYRMDGVIGLPDTWSWPVDDVLRPRTLRAEMLGVLVWVGQAGDQLYLPVSVRDRGTPSATPSDPTMLVLRSPIDIEALAWRWYAVDDPSSGSPQWRIAVDSLTPTGTPITVTVPTGPPRELQIDFEAKVVNRDRPSRLNLRMWRGRG